MSSSPSPRLVPASILLVDDQPLQLDYLKNILNGYYKLKITTQGDLALRILNQGSIDLVLLDVTMPGMDGYEVLRQIKTNAKTANIPVIFLTAHEDNANEAKGLSLGAVDYIRKPSNPELLRARIKTHLELNNYRKHLAKPGC